MVGLSGRTRCMTSCTSDGFHAKMTDDFCNFVSFSCKRKMFATNLSFLNSFSVFWVLFVFLFSFFFVIPCYYCFLIVFIFFLVLLFWCMSFFFCCAFFCILCVLSFFCLCLFLFLSVSFFLMSFLRKYASMLTLISNRFDIWNLNQLLVLLLSVAML